MSGRRLLAVLPGPLVTVQDHGRPGHQRSGVTPAGVIDPIAAAVANALVGNDADAAVLELTMFGGAFEVAGGRARVAVAGPGMPVAIDGRAVSPLTSVTIEPGQRLAIGAAAAGTARACLAVDGGIRTTPVLGSRATHVRSRIGGLTGGPLRPGDVLPLVDGAPDGPEFRLDAGHLPSGSGRVRVVLGPQDDHFTAEGVTTFLDATFTVTADADRMGLRLDGPAVAHRGDFNIVSDGIGMGAIQVPGSGRPIVLLADRQSTGGYPKIACAISADLWRLGQLRPGDQVAFAAITVAAAQAAARARHAWLKALPRLVVPAVRPQPASEVLLAANLVDGVVDGSR
jgi:biotin-dependent carboxylase-like uncharacterized protein